MLKGVIFPSAEEAFKVSAAYLGNAIRAAQLSTGNVEDRADCGSAAGGTAIGSSCL